MRVTGWIARSLILLHRNDLPGAREAAEAELAGTGPRHRSHWAQWARALILEADSQPGQAYAVLAGCWDWCARQGLAAEYRVLGPDLIRLALLYISRRTVQTHLVHVFAKLDIASRAQLAAEVTRHQPEPPKAGTTTSTGARAGDRSLTW